ncbi:GNAT family N-acetyltransferase [Shewanella sp. JM162201]|uniref:GNAT family N-acetyltransferase n=1 Tax=Shewanella jiangmenensis TaxID=2837387 RepID=A0ABS5V7Y8_9GAMM|nr:N-acetyltransferase [Shewanella jiangmenensis]MBT1446078.1 GNAT family N-acetyltransferase [Shewanella jiangmenensis]
MIIRPLDSASWQAAHEVESACFGSHSYPDFFFRQALDAWPRGFAGAFVGDELIGYVLCAPAEQPGLGWVMSLAVLDSHRGLGAGRALMQYCLSLGFTSLRLTVSPENPALGLYQRLGFMQLALENDYFGPGEHRLLLEWRAS